MSCVEFEGKCDDDDDEKKDRITRDLRSLIYLIFTT